jgi:hypothetical protein
MEKNSHHSFTTGFTLGLFSGVVGYYLFGTKQGKKTRDKLAYEWDKAHQHLIDEGVISKNAGFKNLGDFVQSGKDEFLKKLDVEQSKPKTRKAPRKKRSYSRQTKQKQFKGV